MSVDKEHTLVRRLRRAVDLDIEISEVILVGNGTNSWDTVSYWC